MPIRASRIALGGLTLVLAALVGPAVAQESASYRLVEHAMNAGSGVSSAPASANFRLTLDAIGDIDSHTVVGASHSGESGFVTAYRPPMEVVDLVFADEDTLAWRGERSSGEFQLYRDFVSELGGPSIGDCDAWMLDDATANDFAVPPVGEAFLYFVTVRNRLDEEGTPGTDSSGTERVISTVCP